MEENKARIGEVLQVCVLLRISDGRSRGLAPRDCVSRMYVVEEHPSVTRLDLDLQGVR